MLYNVKQINDAMREWFRNLDFDGTRQRLEDMLAQGELEIAGITDEGFVVRPVEHHHEAR